MYINRAAWTSVPPKSNKAADEVSGVGNFRTPVGIIAHTFTDSLTYFNNSPTELLNTKRLDDFNLKGYGDTQYNFAVPSNMNGFFCCRGIISKSSANSSPELNKDYLSILCLIGMTEEPTDQLLENLQDCTSYIQSRYSSVEAVVSIGDVKKGGASFNSELAPLLTKNLSKTASTHRYLPPAPLPVGLTNVHVFDLIEALAFHGYYSSRNDGFYGPICENAVKNLQQDLSERKIYPKNIDGYYGRWTRDCWNTLLNRS